MDDKLNKILGQISELNPLKLEEKVHVYNECTKALKKMLGMNHPVLAIQLVRSETVVANDYNPNTVAPPEMELLKLSIKEDGFTQPIVIYDTGKNNEVVDGFHRHKVGKEDKEVSKSLHGYLPVVVINQDRVDIPDRMASTIRHNRARGKHQVEAMSDIVIELKRRNKTDVWIAKHLGMSPDEVLRLSQITGLTELFKDKDFSMAWERKSAEEIEKEQSEINGKVEH